VGWLDREDEKERTCRIAVLGDDASGQVEEAIGLVALQASGRGDAGLLKGVAVAKDDVGAGLDGQPPSVFFEVDDLACAGVEAGPLVEGRSCVM
jgi:hypothetical protein